MKKVIKIAFEHMRFNKWLSVASVIVVTLTFTISGILLYIMLGVNQYISQLKDSQKIIIFFYPSTPEDSVLEIKNDLEQDTRFSKVEYVSQEEALKIFTDSMQEASQVNIVSADLLPSHINLSLKDINDFDDILSDLNEKLKDNPYVDEIMYSQVAIENLLAISKLFTVNGIIILSMALVVTAFLIYVTINFNVQYYFDEIKIMDLLGGNSRLLVYPFVIEGITYGVFGSIAASLLLLLFRYGNLYLIIQDEILKSFIESKFLYVLHASIRMPNSYEILVSYVKILIMVIIVGIFVGVISSIASVKTTLSNLIKQQSEK